MITVMPTSVACDSLVAILSVVFLFGMTWSILRSVATCRKK